ncbi:MAG TPA: aspartate/glutamate racemase family protein, partial [Acidobacteriota bacterium]|nr:aspartate/glutamate racemase family protein [Acidobacteriota bacterium]
MTKYKKIGILGGMGPEATADFYLRIIRIFQKKYGAIYDSDFPEILIINLPIPDVVENPKEEDKVREMLINAVKKLEKSGADFIAIPCNTVTYYISEMKN